MKSIKYNFATMLLLLLVAGLVPSLAVAAPKAVFPETSHNFGQVAENPDNIHEFTIKNTGDAELVIERITTDCGCTSTQYDSAIAPGQTGAITVKLNTNGYRGHTITRNIKIYLNDPENDPAVLSVSAEVIDIVDIDPPRVSFTGRPGEKLSGVVTIKPLAGYPFKIVSSEARFGQNINFELKEDVKDGQAVYLLTVANTKENVGRYFDEVIIKTDSQALPVISIRVNGTVLPAEN